MEKAVKFIQGNEVCVEVNSNDDGEKACYSSGIGDRRNIAIAYRC